MEIKKNHCIYIVTETAKRWTIKIDIPKLGVSYNIPKDICETFDDLKKYVLENNLF